MYVFKNKPACFRQHTGKGEMDMLKEGDAAPGFLLTDQDGNEVGLEDFKGKKLLLYFYPRANTPGCTQQSCSVRDARDDFEGMNVSRVGISPDTPEKQKKFDTKYDLDFPLLSDPDHVAAEAYGVWGEKSMYGKKYMGIVRSSFLMDEEGKILGAWYKVSPKDTVPKALDRLKVG